MADADAPAAGSKRLTANKAAVIVILTLLLGSLASVVLPADIQLAPPLISSMYLLRVVLAALWLPVLLVLIWKRPRGPLAPLFLNGAWAVLFMMSLGIMLCWCTQFAMFNYSDCEQKITSEGKIQYLCDYCPYEDCDRAVFEEIVHGWPFVRLVSWAGRPLNYR